MNEQTVTFNASDLIPRPVSHYAELGDKAESILNRSCAQDSVSGAFKREKEWGGSPLLSIYRYCLRQRPYRQQFGGVYVCFC